MDAEKNDEPPLDEQELRDDLAQQVKDGLITQSEADRIERKILARHGK